MGKVGKGKGRNASDDSVRLNEEPFSFFSSIFRDSSIIIEFQSIGSGKMNAKSRKSEIAKGTRFLLLAASTLGFRFLPVFGLSLLRDIPIVMLKFRSSPVFHFPFLRSLQLQRIESVLGPDSLT
jgi:hypothetical protein